MSDYNIFTSESVSEGHPDKLADQISDAVLDAILTDDPHARVACETMVKTGVAIVGGEITTSAWVDLEDLVRGVIKDIGYTSRSEEHTSELQSRPHLVCRLLLEKKKNNKYNINELKKLNCE